MSYHPLVTISGITGNRRTIKYRTTMFHCEVMSAESVLCCPPSCEVLNLLIVANQHSSFKFPWGPWCSFYSRLLSWQPGRFHRYGSHKLIATDVLALSHNTQKSHTLKCFTCALHIRGVYYRAMRNTVKFFIDFIFSHFCQTQKKTQKQSK